MARFRSWLLLLLLLAGFVGAAAYVVRARANVGREMPPFSVYSEQRDGLAPTARLVRELGWEPVALTRPIQNTRYRGLLIMEEPRGDTGFEGVEEWPDAEVEGMLRWVAEGNTILLCGAHITGLHRKLGVEVIENPGTVAGEAVPRQAVTLGEGGGYTADIDRLEVEGRDTLRASSGLPLWWVGPQPGALVLPHVNGRVIVVADASLLTRRGLRRQDNVLFLYNVAALDARDGKVFFDEYHHGLRAESGFWEYLRYHGQGWVILPVLVVVAVAGWSVAVRLGPPVPAVGPAHADAVDYAGAVARILRLAGARRLLARGLVRDFLGSLTRQLRLRRGALPAEILGAWRQRHPPETTERLQGLLRGTGELRKGDIGERRLLEWAQAFDQFRSEVMSAS